MQRPRYRFHLVRRLSASLAVLMALGATACQTTGGKPSVRRPGGLGQQLTQCKDENDQQNARLAAKEALIKQLEQWLLSQQRMLDDAMQEVVRVQAKQRTLESRAEAASEIAEAEIALKALRDKAADTNRPEVANAEQLLTRATGEFEKQNFGGSLYLIGQAKGQIKMGALRMGEQRQVEEGEDEVPFVVPLSLKVNARGNLREGPGQEFKVLATLDAGTRITGYFTKGAWMRVESGGYSGWIRRSLVSPN